MKTSTHDTRCFQFCFPGLDTLVQVEECMGAVVIRASRNTFSDRRKLCFIRELAAEGFIADDYRWYSLDATWSVQRVQWRVDPSWLKLDPALAARTRRFMIRLLLSATLLGLLLMAGVVTGVVR